jgi:hypothetical protein
MAIFICGICLFLLAISVHALACRVFKSKRPTKLLLSISFWTLCIGLLMIWLVQFLFKTPFSILAFDVLGYINITLFFFPLLCAYTITFSAVEADSPSLVMILAIAQAAPAGLSEDDFYLLVNDEVLIKPRLKDLLKDKMAYLDGTRYKITTRGKYFVHLFVIYRNLLGLQKGG